MFALNVKLCSGAIDQKGKDVKEMESLQHTLIF